MRIIEIKALANGAHRNQNGGVSSVPGGWAVIPDGFGEMQNFPFGEVAAEEINGVMTVTGWTPSEVPEVAENEIEDTPTQLDRIEAQVTYTAMMTDTLLEV